MQKEVTLDIFWEALRHSQLFSAQDMPFKRAVSLEMKSEYYLPGDYIYTLGKVKSKMIYIVSGILQVLTEEDDESPIISFSSGTLIGETSVMLPTKSIANLRSATYSKLYTLSVKGMAKALLAFPNKRLPVKNYLDEKLRMAESLRQKRLVKENEEKDNLFIDVKGDTTIMWLKKRWRALRKIQETGSHDDQIITIPTEYYHTTKNFDMMVFGAEVELKIEAICLKGRCPFVMEPNSSFRKFWDVLTLAIVLIQSIVLPYNIAFNRTFSRKLLSWLSVLDIVYLADLYMQLSTAVTGNVIITKPLEIILYRAKRLMFLVDVFAAFPFDYIALVYGASSHTVALFKTNRIFKIVKLLAFLQDAERNLVRNSMYVRIVKYVLIYIISTYWLSCLLFAMSCFHEECDQYGWYRYNRYLKDKQGLVIDDDRYAFTHSVFYTMGATFRLSLSNNFEYTPFDMTVFYLGVSFGNYLFAFFVSEICATFILQQQDMIKYREHIKGTQHHMTKNKIPEKLRQQVSDILQFKWQHNENTTELGTDGILQDLPEHLKEKIIWNRIKECLQNAPLFQNCDDEFVNNICAKAKLITLPEDVVICTANYKSPRMHFIIRGYCTQRSTMAGDRERRKDEILKPGDSFPIVETIHQVLTFINVRSLTTVEMVSVSYFDFIEVLRRNIDIMSTFNFVLNKHMELFKSQLMRLGGRLPLMIPSEKSLGPGAMFKYKILDKEESDRSKRDYMHPFQQLGKYSFIRFFFLRFTIDPKRRFFICWEASRYINAIVRTVSAICMHNLLIKYYCILQTTNDCLDFLTIVDFYIRMHCQYYNEQGLLVTHPLYTAKNYLKTSFFLDVWCISASFKNRLQGNGMNHNFIAKSNVIFQMMTQPLHLYRPIQGLFYFQRNIEGNNSNVLLAIVYIIIAATFIGICGTLIQLFTCNIELDSSNNAKVWCEKNSWIRVISNGNNEIGPAQIYLKSFYLAFVLFTSVITGYFSLPRNKDILLIIPIFLLLYFLKCYILAKLVSRRIGGNIILTTCQEKVKSFENYVKYEPVDEDLAASTVEHFRYVWKRTSGIGIANVFKEFHFNLRAELSNYLYGSTLRLVDFFSDADDSFIRLLGAHFQEVYFKKDAEIIRTNDVNDQVYFVYKGRVDVIVAKSKIATLARGGIFGCLARNGRTRQTIAVRAKVHVALLVISAVEFHKIIRQYTSIDLAIQHVNFTHCEYLETTKQANEEAVSISSHSVPSSKHIVKRFWFTLRHLIYERNGWYLTWNYLVCVHVGPLTSLIYSFFVIIYDMHQKSIKNLIIFSAVTDLVFYAKIYVGFHLAYKDPESGLTVTDFKVIGKKYFLSLGKFWLDLLTTLPFEWMIYGATGDFRHMKYGYCNRILRCVYLNRYYSEKESNLKVKNHLRWAYLLYRVLFMVQLMAILWWIAACPNNTCMQFQPVNTYNKTMGYCSDSADSILTAYTQAVNVFTASGYRMTGPHTDIEVSAILIMTALYFMPVVVLAGGFATMLQIANYTMANFEHDIEELRIYLKGLELSPFIFNNVWKYLLQMWHRQRGEWLPSLIAEAPAYLKQDLMQSLYGNHVRRHYLFSRTHVDFIRQLVVHLRRCVFFPGNFLVEKGDVDGSMYFVQEGMVYVYDKQEDSNIPQEVLIRGCSFGEAQGLYHIPHVYSYKAHTVVEVVILKRQDWEYLLDWFPASKIEVFSKAREHCLDNVQV